MYAAILLLALLDSPFDFHAAARDPYVLPVLQDLAHRGLLQFDDREIAAFIVRNKDGNVHCLLWPHRAQRRSERYDGKVPAGTVAIAHTHPFNAEAPSRGDIEQSQRAGLPIFVVTRTSLYVVDPESGQSLPLILHKSWTGAAAKQCRCEEKWPRETADTRDVASGVASH